LIFAHVPNVPLVEIKQGLITKNKRQTGDGVMKKMKRFSGMEIENVSSDVVKGGRHEPRIVGDHSMSWGV
jgi:hypothetical protein